MTERTSHRTGPALEGVARGAAGVLGGAALSTVAGFGLVVLLARSVPAATAGTFFSVTAVFVVALALSELGTDTGLARYLQRWPPCRSGAAGALLKVAAAPVVITALGIAALLAVGAGSSGLRAVAWALPLAAVSDFLLSVTRAHARFAPTVLVDRILRPALQVSAVGAALALDANAAGLAAAWVAPYAVTVVLAAAAARSLLPSAPAVPSAPGVPLAGVPSSAVAAREFWGFTAPRAAARIAQVTIQKADIVLVAWLLGVTAAAAYAVATRFVVLGQLANQAVATVVQPRFTTLLLADDRVAVREVFAVATRWSVLLAWPVYLLVAAAPGAYLGWFGGEYGAAANRTVVVVMALGMLVAVASGPVDTLLLMAGRSGLSLMNTLVALAVDIGLCLVLVPVIGIIGAAVAWVAALGVRCGLAIHQLRHELDLSIAGGPLLVAAALPVACVAVPVLLVDQVLGLGPAAWLLTGAVVAAGYVALAWRLRERLALDVFVSGLRNRRSRTSKHPEVVT